MGDSSRRVAVLYCDIADSTRLYESVGDAIALGAELLGCPHVFNVLTPYQAVS